MYEICFLNNLCPCYLSLTFSSCNDRQAGKLSWGRLSSLGMSKIRVSGKRMSVTCCLAGMLL
jgi:hypothetical protein